VYPLSVVLTLTLAGLIAGIFIGIFFNQRKGKQSLRQADLERQVQDMQQQQQGYQEEVGNHFQQTAELLNQLTDSYKDVHTHLSKGAHLLADANTSASIKTLGADSPQNEENENTSINPPLDYADSSGTLSEDWGIKKAAMAEERNESGFPNSPA
jgi:uncharacterized membrane-anchored protein YhcB (DUF1043 family)